jgi:hypothetical protein
MGYCYPTGKKVNGRWKFLKCDGRSNKCAQDGGPVPNISTDARIQRCVFCGEYCKTWLEAKRAVEEYDRTHEKF